MSSLNRTPGYSPGYSLKITETRRSGIGTMQGVRNAITRAIRFAQDNRGNTPTHIIVPDVYCTNDLLEFLSKNKLTRVTHVKHINSSTPTHIWIGWWVTSITGEQSMENNQDSSKTLVVEEDGLTYEFELKQNNSILFPNKEESSIDLWYLKDDDGYYSIMAAQYNNQKKVWVWTDVSAYFVNEIVTAVSPTKMLTSITQARNLEKATSMPIMDFYDVYVPDYQTE